MVALNVDLAAQPKRAAHRGAFPPIGGKVRPERPGRFGRETRCPRFSWHVAGGVLHAAALSILLNRGVRERGGNRLNRPQRTAEDVL